MRLNGKETGKENKIGKSASHAFEASRERDMLEGNIARMFVSHDIDEIIEMYLYAKFRINMIYHYCLKMYEERSQNDASNS